MEKRKVFIDMDDVICDFDAGLKDHGDHHEMYEVGYFARLPVTEGSLSSVRRLVAKYDVWILSQPVQDSSHSYSEKAAWIMRHFPDLKGRLILTQDKGLLSREGYVLIDDNTDKWGHVWKEHGGLFFHFDKRLSSMDNWAEVFRKFEHYCGTDNFYSVKEGF